MGVCLSWDLPGSDAAATLWVTLAQRCSTCIRTAMDSIAPKEASVIEHVSPLAPFSDQVRPASSPVRAVRESIDRWIDET